MDGLLRGIIGILIGVGLYPEVYPHLKDGVLRVGVYGKITLPGLLGVNHWVVIIPLVLVVGGLLLWIDGKGR